MELVACDTQKSAFPEANSVPVCFCASLGPRNSLLPQRKGNIGSHPLLTMVSTKTQLGTVFQINSQVCVFALIFLVWALNISLWMHYRKKKKKTG